jgi:hypothetical protein
VISVPSGKSAASPAGNAANSLNRGLGQLEQRS